jgi:hypothetical protein
MCVFLRAAAWLVNFPSVAHGRLSIRGRSSVTPCLEKTRTSQHPMSTSRVGPASAMGSGRVGCSSYPSVQFSDHAIIYFVFLFVLVTSRRCPRTITYTQTFCHGSPVGDTTSLRLGHNFVRSSSCVAFPRVIVVHPSAELVCDQRPEPHASYCEAVFGQFGCSELIFLLLLI